jgi:hypothetical protein
MLTKADERTYSYDRLQSMPDNKKDKEPVPDWGWPEEQWYQLPYGIQVYEHSRYREEVAWGLMTPAKLAQIDEYRLNKMMWENDALAEAVLSMPRNDFWEPR